MSKLNLKIQKVMLKFVILINIGLIWKIIYEYICFLLNLFMKLEHTTPPTHKSQPSSTQNLTHQQHNQNQSVSRIPVTMDKGEGSEVKNMEWLHISLLQ